MAEKITLELEAKLGEAIKRLDNLEKGIKDVGKEAKKSSKAMGGIKKALSGVGAILTGGAFKLGAVIFEKLTELFMSNQKVVDAMSTGMNFLKVAFSDLVEFISNFSMPTFTELKDIVIQGTIDRFNELMEVFGLIGKSFMKLVKGDFKGAFETIKEAGKEVVDVYTGQDKSFEKVTKSITNYAKETFKAAQNLTDLNKQAQLNEALNAKLLLQYSNEAELQRQLRDDTSASIEDRIAANEKLGEVLDKQEQAMMANAKENIVIAEANLALDKNNLDLQLALIQAQTDLIDVEETVNGFRSEQLTNTNSLLKEEKDLKDQNIKDAQDQLEKENKDKEDQAALEEKLRQQKLQGMVSNLDAVRATAGEETKIGQALFAARQGMLVKEQIAEAKATLSKITMKASESGVALAQGTAETAKVGFPQNIPLLIAFAAQAVGIISAINAAVGAARSDISSASPSVGGGATGSVNFTPTASAPPDFNLVGQSSESQLAQAIGQNDQKPIKAFVVSSDVSNAQALDRNIIESASIG